MSLSSHTDFTFEELLDHLRPLLRWDDSEEFDGALEDLGFDQPAYREFVEMHRWGPIFRDTYQHLETGRYFQVKRRVGNEDQTDGVDDLAEVVPQTIMVTAYRRVPL